MKFPRRVYHQLPHDVYVLKSDIKKLDQGSVVLAHLHVEKKSQYTIVDKNALQPAIKRNDNTYEVCLIFK